MLSRLFALVFASVLILPALAPAQTASMAKPEDQVLKLEKDRFAAMIKVDEAALNRLMGDDLAYVHSTAQLQTKAEFLATLKAGNVHYISLVPSDPDVKVRIIGNVAVVNGLAAVHVVDTGLDKTMKIRYTDVHVNRNGAWQLVSWQSTVIGTAVVVPVAPAK